MVFLVSKSTNSVVSLFFPSFRDHKGHLHEEPEHEDPVCSCHTHHSWMLRIPALWPCRLFSTKKEVRGNYYAFRWTSKLCMVLLTSLVAHRMFSTSACLICCSLVSNTMYFHYVILQCCKSCSETLDIYAVICLREMGLVPQWCCSPPVLCAESIFSKPWVTYKALWHISTILQQLCNLFKGSLDLFIHTRWVSIKCVAVDFKYSLISTLGTINLLHLQALASLSSECFASFGFLK